MIFSAQTDVNGFGAYAKGTDFNCNAAICYAIGAERHREFQRFQTLLNVFAVPAGRPATVGFSSLVVDGFIGDATVRAAVSVAKAIVALGLPGQNWVQQITGGITKEKLASLVDDFNPILAAAGQAYEKSKAAAGLPPAPVIPPSPTAPPPTSPSPPFVPTPVASRPTTPTTTFPSTSAPSVPIFPALYTPAAPTAIPAPPTKSKLPWILGGVAAVLLVGGVGFVYYRRKARASSG